MEFQACALPICHLSNPPLEFELGLEISILGKRGPLTLEYRDEALDQLGELGRPCAPGRGWNFRRVLSRSAIPQPRRSNSSSVSKSASWANVGPSRSSTAMKRSTSSESWEDLAPRVGDGISGVCSPDLPSPNPAARIRARSRNQHPGQTWAPHARVPR